MNFPTPLPSASGPNSLRRVANRPRAPRLGPRLGLSLLTVALMALVSVSAPPTAQAAAPDAPTSFSVQPQSTGVSASNFDSLALTWTAPSGAITHFEISVDDGSTWEHLKDAGSTTAENNSADISAHDFDMSPGHTYKLKVRAVNDDGDGAASDAVALILLGADMGANAVTLRWTSPDNSDIAKWQYQRDSGGWTDIAGGASATSVTDTSVENQTAYTYQVRGVNSGGTAVLTSSSLPVIIGKMAYGVRGVTAEMDAFGIDTAVCAADDSLFVGTSNANNDRGTVQVFTKSGPVWSHSDTIGDNTHGLSLGGTT